MKALIIIGIIYLVSFLVLFLFWFITTIILKRESSLDGKWWYYLVFVIFAPIFAIAILVASIVTLFRKDKQEVEKDKTNKSKPWYEIKGDGLPKKKTLEDEVFQRDRSSMHECVESERNILITMARRCMNALNLICITGRNVETTMEDHRLLEELNLIRSKKYGPVEAVLLPEGYTLCVDFDCGDIYAKSTHFFVQNKEGIADYKIYNYLKFEDSYKGAMAAYLIYTAWYNLRLSGHAFNLNRQYVFSDIESGVIPDDISELDKEMLMAMLENKDLISPQVYWSSNMAYVECSYWSSHEGLIRETLQIKFENGYVRELNELPDKILYKYDCGIRFF